MRRYFAMFFVGLGLLFAPAPAEAVTLKTARFVAGFEGFVSCPYNDPAGHATIGYGHLLHLGPVTRADRRKWGCISQARAYQILRRDLRRFEIEVYKRIRGVRVNPPMITALTSFAFNLGPGYLDFIPRRGKRPATNVTRALRVGKYRRAARQMLYFNGVIVGNKRYVLEGLRIRRRKEYRLMMIGIRRLEANKVAPKNQNGNQRGTQTSTGGLRAG